MSQPTPQPQPKHRERVTSLRAKIGDGLIKYDATPQHDALIAAAYFRMVDEGSALAVIPDGSLSSLMIAIHAPSTAYFKIDERGIWFLAWYEPNQILGQLFAVWVAKEKRGTKANVLAGMEVLRIGIRAFHEIVAITESRELVDKAHVFGYSFVGTIPASQRRNERYIIHLVENSEEDH